MKAEKAKRVRRVVYLSPEADEVYRWAAEQLKEYPGHIMAEVLDMIACYLEEVRKDIQRFDEGVSEGFLIRSLMRRAFLGLADILDSSGDRAAGDKG